LKQSVSALSEADDKGVGTTSKDVRGDFILALFYQSPARTGRVFDVDRMLLGTLAGLR